MQNTYFYVYILSNKHHTVFYTGITNDLVRRVSEHRTKVIKGFTQRYNIYKLLYYEVYENPTEAIAREKQIKKYSRKKKFTLIDNLNPEWRDMFEDEMDYSSK